LVIIRNVEAVEDFPSLQSVNGVTEREKRTQSQRIGESKVRLRKLTKLTKVAARYQYDDQTNTNQFDDGVR